MPNSGTLRATKKYTEYTLGRDELDKINNPWSTLVIDQKKFGSLGEKPLLIQADSKSIGTDIIKN